MATIDLKNGIYRRIYSMAIRGQRINSVSFGAEACFWRLHLVADDFGNLEGSIDLLLAQAFTRRRGVTDEMLRGWLEELERANLITVYNDGVETYIHIDNFEELQPKGKNGKRVSKYPQSADSGMSDGFLDDSTRGNFQDSPESEIPIIPTESSDSRLHKEHEHEHPQKHDKEHEQHEPETPQAVQPAFDPVGEIVNSGGGSGACSPEPETQAQPPAEPSEPTPDYNREHGFIRWTAAVEPLIGVEGDRRHPPQSAKWNRDLVSIEAWFTERIWPREIDPGKGHQRLQFALERAKRAPKEAENPIKYLAYHTKNIGTF